MSDQDYEGMRCCRCGALWESHGDGDNCPGFLPARLVTPKDPTVHPSHHGTGYQWVCSCGKFGMYLGAPESRDAIQRMALLHMARRPDVHQVNVRPLVVKSDQCKECETTPLLFTA